jgi:hypothetical protein
MYEPLLTMIKFLLTNGWICTVQVTAAYILWLVKPPIAAGSNFILCHHFIAFYYVVITVTKFA